MDDNITISTLDNDEDIGSLTITTTNASYYGSLHGSLPNYTIGGGTVGSNSSYTTNTLNSPYSFTQPTSGLRVNGTAEFEGDVKIKGVSIAKMLEDIQKRLAILVPDPAKLEHFEALKKSYDHYKTLEALCEIPKKDD